MIFSSNVFLFWFLPTVLIIYYLLHAKLRNWFLLAASLLFYAWGEPKFVLVMIGSILFNYLMALAIGEERRREEKLHRILAKLLLWITVIGNLGLLFIYKYLDFTITNINRLGFQIPLKELVLPIGISFFTFQAMSYVLDVYFKTVDVQRKPQNLGLYISFFPQLIAGPIVRYQTIAAQIDNRQHTVSDFSEGVRRFIIGFSKKVLLANNMALVADKAFNMPDPERSILFAWIGAIAYSLQILFDFSGYSEMAIGLGKMFGFHFLENFDYPYISKSISEFWRRWHMSLGQWFRDYVYFPLGGSRVKTKKRLIFNLFVVWSLTGIWHGASWNFIFWGLIYFVLIAFEKLTKYPDKFKSKSAKIVYQFFTMLCVVGGWVLFRASGLRAAMSYLFSMLGLTDNSFTSVDVVVALREYWWFFLIALLCSTPIFRSLAHRIDTSGHRYLVSTFHTGRVIVYLFLLIWSVSFIMLGSHNPFIYFNF